MDPNLLKQIEYFLEPNSQVSLASESFCCSIINQDTGKRYENGMTKLVHCSHTSQTSHPDSQQQQHRFAAAAASSSSGSAPNFWDIAGLNVDSGLGSPSSPASLSFESFGQSTNAKSPHQQQQQQQQQPRTMTSGPESTPSSRVILPPRPPRTKAGHERKRTKLSTETTPFDNVDYWIQFDNEEDAEAGAGSSGLTHEKSKAMQSSHHHSSQPTPRHPHQQQQQQQR